MEIALADIQPHASSYVDPNGFVFHFEDKIYRGISRGKEKFYRSLFENGTVRTLIRHHDLVDSEPTSMQIPEAGCDFVIEHRKIEPLTYCVEWSPSMLQRAARSLMELNLALAENDCLLQDAYPWNILFEGTRPVHVDFTSIVPAHEQNLLWPAYQQFLNFFLYPLQLASMGKGALARSLLLDYIHGVSLDDLNRHMSFRYKLRHPVSFAMNRALGWANGRAQNHPGWKVDLGQSLSQPDPNGANRKLRLRFFKGLLKKIEAAGTTPGPDRWVNYYEEFEGADPEIKINLMDRLLNRIQPQTVLDLGCNRGRFSILAAQHGARVIAVDGSESCVDALYRNASADDYAITPVVGNVLNPTPAFGFMSGQFPSMVTRFRSEVVLCLALMHHLHINGRQPFDRIARLLDALSSRAVIFEYVDPEDANNRLLDCGREIHYNLESVSGALSRFFKIQVFDSDRDTRKILLCEKL